MTITLAPLPYDREALAPHISKETIDFHYGKHHQAYVDKLNSLISKTKWASQSLEEMIQEAEGAIFNNAAQVWNHSFYWNGLKSKGGGEPSGKLLEQIVATFGSFSDFKEKFKTAALNQFGSGWAWLIKDQSGELSILTSSNADNPLRHGLKPILTCDVWEHAYYIDYRNARATYLDAFWQIVNWEF